jgi:hypothetical protein
VMVKKTCAAKSCNRPARRWGLCNTHSVRHYRQSRRSEVQSGRSSTANAAEVGYSQVPGSIGAKSAPSEQAFVTKNSASESVRILGSEKLTPEQIERCIRWARARSIETMLEHEVSFVLGSEHMGGGGA